MMNGKVPPMDEDSNRSGLKRVLLAIMCGLALIFLIGVTAGFLAAHMEDGGGAPSAAGYAVLAGILALAAGTLFVLVRTLKAQSHAEPATTREKLNRNILIGCGLLGGIVGVVMVMAGEPDMMLSSAPMAPALAIGVVFVIGVIVPIICWYWHTRAIDEQEAEAYKLGALGGIYVYTIGAPCWWFLWRGGLVPEPSGLVIYFITIFTVSIIWMWRKYR